MAKDIFHQQVKNALIKDGWKITHDPLTIRISEAVTTRAFSPFEDKPCVFRRPKGYPHSRASRFARPEDSPLG